MGVARPFNALFARLDSFRAVTDDLAFYQVDHVLGDVGGVVGDALQVAGG